MNNNLKIHKNDNVVVRLLDGHKIASVNIKKGEKIFKYGYPIGIATEEIKKGEWVHTHNIKTSLEGKTDYYYNKSELQNKSFDVEDNFFGYSRVNGDVGIRNEIWIIPTVGCVNQIAKNLENILKEKFLINEYFDGAYAFTHPYGCSQMGDDQENTRKTLAGLAKNPNAGGVLIVGLGCENTNIETLKTYLGDYDKDRIRFLVCQDIEDEYQEGICLVAELIDNMKSDKRQNISVSKLKVGLKCGGSDGFSGITANPLVGKFSDILVSKGGALILTEVPEMFGAEILLMNRAKNKIIFTKIVNLINRFKDYFSEHHQIIYDNPSPGNKEGGITTLEEKSLGCIQKGGESQIVDVLEYGELLTKSGINLLYGPGNDIVSTTAMAASGCQLILFTTGRGTPLGTVIPTLKIATNSKIYEKKRSWFDFNAGVILDGKDIDELSIELYKKVIETINGNAASNENMGFREIAIFKGGVTL